MHFEMERILREYSRGLINPLNVELNPICQLLTLSCTILQELRKNTKHVIQVTKRQVLSSKWFYCFCMCSNQFNLVSRYQSSAKITASILRINA